MVEASQPLIARNLLSLPRHWFLLPAAALAAIAQTLLAPMHGVPAAVLIASAAAIIWARGVSLHDPDAFRATLGNNAFRWLLLGFSAVLFMDFSASFWLIPLAQRRFGLDARLAGAELGGLMIVGGIIGSVLGGLIADHWRRRTPVGRVWTVLIVVILEALAIGVAAQATSYPSFRIAFGIFCLASGGWTGVAAALGLELVPRVHRGTAIAVYFLVTTLLGPGLGAWAGGAFADWLESLSQAMIGCAAVAVVAVAFFIKLARTPPI